MTPYSTRGFTDTIRRILPLFALKEPEKTDAEDPSPASRRHRHYQSIAQGNAMADLERRLRDSW